MCARGASVYLDSLSFSSASVFYSNRLIRGKIQWMGMASGASSSSGSSFFGLFIPANDFYSVVSISAGDTIGIDIGSSPSSSGSVFLSFFGTEADSISFASSCSARCPSRFLCLPFYFHSVLFWSIVPPRPQALPSQARAWAWTELWGPLRARFHPSPSV